MRSSHAAVQYVSWAVAGDDQLPRPAVWSGRGQLPGLLIDPGVAGQHRPGTGGVHHEAGGVRAQEHPQPPPRRAASLARGEHVPGGLIGVQVPRGPGPGDDRLLHRGQ